MTPTKKKPVLLNFAFKVVTKNMMIWSKNKLLLVIIRAFLVTWARNGLCDNFQWSTWLCCHWLSDGHWFWPKLSQFCLVYISKLPIATLEYQTLCLCWPCYPPRAFLWSLWHTRSPAETADCSQPGSGRKSGTCEDWSHLPWSPGKEI